MKLKVTLSLTVSPAFPVTVVPNVVTIVVLNIGGGTSHLPYKGTTLGTMFHAVPPFSILLSIIYKNIFKRFCYRDFARNPQYFDNGVGVFEVAELNELIGFCKLLRVFSPLF